MTAPAPTPEAASAREGSLEPAARVLICEDSRHMRDYLVTGLGHFDLRVSGVAHGVALDEALAKGEPDLIILDLGLPGEDGYAIAERLRRERPHLGIIMLTSRDGLEDRIKGLAGGADLYFAKPIDLRELAAAIGSLRRRLQGRPAQGWRVDRLGSCLHTPGGVSVPLTDLELRFLLPLVARPGEVVAREELLLAMEQRADIYAMRSMATLVSRLRTKVKGMTQGEALPVRARHGKGYAFLCATQG